MHPRHLLAAGALAGLVLAQQPATVPPEPNPHETLTTAVISDETAAIRLVTGDLAALSPDGAVELEPAEGREHIGFTTRTSSEGVYVFPNDTAVLLAEGRLDPELFNLSSLTADGFGGGEPLPLLIQGEGTAARSSALPAAEITRRLDSIGAVAVTTADSAALWEQLSATANKSSATDRIWLDGRSKPLLDESVPQIGAPEVWRSGFDGTGTAVAVLDSGADLTHPDLVGRITETRDFTGSPNGVTDLNGHGTHVASTVAGTGAASGGRYTGVAPGAALLIGKVCADEGYCTDSAVIAGMEWAAADADVVNLSLGGGPSDGTDPMELAVNALSEATGALFVIAAGNDGTPSSVSTPAAADAALAVGSVSKKDVFSAFSNQGPRYGDNALKPELTAPGEAIVAAHAEGTELGPIVDGEYTRLSGTSMATPHVAGAAALLKQRHPDWNAAQLKATLMATSRWLDGPGLYQQGSGRLDVARAVRQEVTASIGALDFATVAFPQDGRVEERTVTYANPSAAPVTLALGASVRTGGAEAPAGLFTVDGPALTVPAGGTAAVTMSLDTSIAFTTGQYAGELVASVGETVIRTAVSAYLEPEKHTQEIHGTARDGSDPYSISVAYTDLATGDTEYVTVGGAEARLRLEPGTYHVLGFVTDRLDFPYNTPTTAFADTLTVTGAGELDWDARQGKELTVDLDRDTYLDVTALGLASAPGGVVAAENLQAYAFGQPVYAVPSPADGGSGILFVYAPLHLNPEGSARHFQYNLAFAEPNGIPGDLSHRVHDRDLAVEDAVYESQGEAPAAWGRNSPSFAGGFSLGYSPVDLTLPDRRTEYFTPGPDISWWSALSILRSSVGSGEEFVREGERTGHTRVDWTSAPLAPGPSRSGVEDLGATRDGTGLAVLEPMFAGPDLGVATRIDWSTVTGTTAVLADGVSLGATDAPCQGTFGAPVTATRFTVSCTADRTAPWTVLGTHAEATWTATAASTGEAAPVALTSVALDSGTVVDGFAPAGRWQPLDLEVYQPSGAADLATTSLALDISYDDGATWRTVPLLRLGDHAKAFVRHPADARFVSVRMTATDSAGGSYTGTMIRSFGLR
ncbi:S8 family serine peptidase [Phytomonospora sp. NPDC050363]|uniref:S8 family peptidase n=1 Tax=Phytomonospora sp. NPDC050363 TaxID=3155642 RepID=UPI0033E73808